MDMTSEQHDQQGPACPECSGLYMPWITTCPRCDIPLATGTEATALADQVAPMMQTSSSWLDIAVSSDEPVKVALLCHFLTEKEVDFEQSRRFVSVRAEHASQLETAVEAWAFSQDLPDDDRHTDSLASTLREIGHAVLSAIHGSQDSALPRSRETVDAVSSSRIDLRA